MPFGQVDNHPCDTRLECTALVRFATNTSYKQPIYSTNFIVSVGLLKSRWGPTRLDAYNLKMACAYGVLLFLDLKHNNFASSFD